METDHQMNDSDDELEPTPAANPYAVAGIVLSGLVAFVGLFLVPPLRDAGLTFTQAFWVATALEGIGALGAIVSILRLYDGGD